MESLAHDDNEIIDLPNALSYSDFDNYVCETCGVILFEYPRAQIENPHAGKSYICPKCARITDSSLTKLKHIDVIKPIDLGNPMEMVDTIKESKGDPIREPEFDIDVEHDKWLESQGFKIIDKKIERST